MGTTPAQLRSELKELGLRLPHGYDIVRRKPKKKPAAKKKPSVQKSKSTVGKAKPAVRKKTIPSRKTKTIAWTSVAKKATHPYFKVGDLLIAGSDLNVPVKPLDYFVIDRIFKHQEYGIVAVGISRKSNKKHSLICEPVKSKSGQWYLDDLESPYAKSLFYWKPKKSTPKKK